MKNRASSHLLLLLIIIGLEIAVYFAVYRSGLIRGYETSISGAVRDLLLYIPILFLVIWLARGMKYVGNWALYTTAILLFSIGMVVQYRLFFDPEYGARNKAAARTEKTETLRKRFMQENYDAEKKRRLGLPPTPPAPVDIDKQEVKPSTFTAASALVSSNTWIPIFAFIAFAGAFWFCRQDRFLQWIQRHGFIIVLMTLVPLGAAVVTSQAGKVGNMTPWEPSKIPFLLGFAGILTARYKELARTYWGIPRAVDVLPLAAMATVPFIPFFALKDFGQMLVFGGAYATLYLVAVRRWPQLLLFVGSVALVGAILVVGALPRTTQETVPFLPTLAKPVKAALPDRIQQRFHLWIDGFTPPSPEVAWWKKDYEDALSRNPRMRELAAQGLDAQRSVNVDVWFDRAAFQPAQAIFGIAAGGTTGRGIGLGFAEIIPVADSDYIYSAIGEEFGLMGGGLVIMALIIFVAAGIRTAIEGRDMFTKLCSAGLTAFIGFQALVNIGGVVRALPMTGITLPFVSHGGFSLITSFAMLGMLMAFSHRNALDARAALENAKSYRDPSIPEAVQ